MMSKLKDFFIYTVYAGQMQGHGIIHGNDMNSKYSSLSYQL